MKTDNAGRKGSAGNEADIIIENKRNHKLGNRKLREFGKHMYIALGTFLMAIAYKSVYDSAGMVTGGFSGISIIVRNVTGKMLLSNASGGVWENAMGGMWQDGIPIWITNMALNIPLYFVAYRVYGKRFVMSTVEGTLLLSFFLAVLPSAHVGDTDYLLAAVFGGLAAGTGIGMILRAGVTTGGTDLLAVIIHHYIGRYSVVQIMQLLDACIIILGIFVFGINTSLYGIIAIYITAIMSKRVVEGKQRASQVIIISDMHRQIASRIMQELQRGVTYIEGQGVYSEKEKKLILCVVSIKQLPEIRKIALETDPGSFLFIGDVCEVLGEGFVQN